MTRTGLGKKSDGWAMECDFCFTRVGGVRPRDDDFPLIEFADLRWQISMRSDCCPKCQEHGKSVSDPVWDRDRLLRDFEQTVEHCMKYYSRAPQSSAVGKYATVEVKG